MGKWDHVVKKLPPESPANPKFQERVDVLKRPLHGQSAAGLANMYSHLRNEKAELEKTMSDLNVGIAATEQAMWDSFENEGISSLKLVDGGSVRADKVPVASVKDRIALRKWAMSNGHENDLTILWQTMNSISKALIEAGEATPDGVELAVRTKTVYTKG